MPDTPASPILVDPSPVNDSAASAMRTLFVLIGGVSAIIGFLGKHDVSGLVAYLQSGAFVPIAGAALAVGSFLYGQWKMIRRKRTMVTLAQAAPDDVAVVQSPSSSSPPSP